MFGKKQSGSSWQLRAGWTKSTLRGRRQIQWSQPWPFHLSEVCCLPRKCGLIQSTESRGGDPSPRSCPDLTRNVLWDKKNSFRDAEGVQASVCKVSMCNSQQMSRQQFSINIDLEDLSRPKESSQNLKPHHQPHDHQQQVSLPGNGDDLSQKPCSLAAGWSPNQEVSRWILSSFWHLLFGSEKQSPQAPPITKTDRGSNKCSSVFGIKALINEKEEHLSAVGKD